MNQTLEDLLPLSVWKSLEEQLHKATGMSCAVFDMQGKKLTDYKNWANTLCPIIKGQQHSLQAICAAANQHIIRETEKTKKPVQSECDAGCAKFCVPIRSNGSIVGVFGGCGLKKPSDQVNTFFISKLTCMEEDALQKLAQSVYSVSQRQLDAFLDLAQNLVTQALEESESISSP